MRRRSSAREIGEKFRNMGQRTFTQNTLFYGDNLNILREYLADESVDLIYLDPPFNSQRNYNVLFKDESGTESEAQITAFEDTWHWSEAPYKELQDTAPDALRQLLDTLVNILGRNQMTAYLVMMSLRIIELRRVLKPTGSLYLHCDPTASHYLKTVLDMIFGLQNYRNEIPWKRTSAHNDAKRFGNIHDILFYYAKDATQMFFNPVHVPYDEKYLESEFRKDQDGRWYKVEDLTAPWHGGDGGRFKFHGRMPGHSRMWRLNQEKMEELWQQGRIKIGEDGRPLLRGHIVYLDEKKGMPVQDWWGDVLRVGNTSKERLGYPTQKPLALLERILQSSSQEGAVVLDPFCGCGTTIHAAQKLNRTWIGIDITHLAIALIKNRLKGAFDLEKNYGYAVVGEPEDLQGAIHLAESVDRYQFQWWAISLIAARPYGGDAGSKRGKKGADHGIDGIIAFQDDPRSPAKRVIVQVKSGKVSVRDIRELRGTLDREAHAEIGVFLTLQPPSEPMRTEAESCGFYTSPTWRKDYPRMQILTIEQLLRGETVKMPPTATTYKKAQREQEQNIEQEELL